VNLLILVVDDEPDVELLFRQQFRHDLRAGRFTMEFAASAPAARLTLGLRIAIGRDHDDRNVRPHGLRLGQEFKTAHPRHVDVGQDQDDR
jgi:hypothetical protein